MGLGCGTGTVSERGSLSNIAYTIHEENKKPLIIKFSKTKNPRNKQSPYFIPKEISRYLLHINTSHFSPVAVVRSLGGNQEAAIIGGAAIIRVPGIPTKMAQM